MGKNATLTKLDFRKSFYIHSSSSKKEEGHYALGNNFRKNSLKTSQINDTQDKTLDHFLDDKKGPA